MFGHPGSEPYIWHPQPPSSGSANPQPQVGPTSESPFYRPETQCTAVQGRAGVTAEPGNLKRIAIPSRTYLGNSEEKSSIDLLYIDFIFPTTFAELPDAGRLRSLARRFALFKGLLSVGGCGCGGLIDTSASRNFAMSPNLNP